MLIYVELAVIIIVTVLLLRVATAVVKERGAIGALFLLGAAICYICQLLNCFRVFRDLFCLVQRGIAGETAYEYPKGTFVPLIPMVVCLIISSVLGHFYRRRVNSLSLDYSAECDEDFENDEGE